MNELEFPRIGERFAERYVILGMLGVGGYARVYKAQHSESQQVVALKILRFERSSSITDEHVRRNALRFEREARLIAGLRSDYTISLKSYGKTPEGLFFMVLEFADGPTLEELITAHGPLSSARAGRLLAQLGSCLAEAHALGVLHRDLKPSNIVVLGAGTPNEQIRLLDFGIAKIMEDDTAINLTAEGRVLGTPKYMDPHYIRTTDYGPLSDVYGMGLIGYELLAGEPAVRSDSKALMFKAQISPESFKLPEGAGQDPALNKVIEAMLEKDVRRRVHSVAKIMELLGRLGYTQAPRRKHAIESLLTRVHPVIAILAFFVIGVVMGLVIWFVVRAM